MEKILNGFKAISLLIIIPILALMSIGCTDKTANKLDKSCVFGTTEVGYITSEELFNFELLQGDTYIFKSLNNDAVVSMSQLYSDTEDEDIYNSLISSYESDGYNNLGVRKSNNGVEGTLLYNIRFDNNLSERYTNLLDEVTEKNPQSKSFIFITDDCKIIEIYSYEQKAMELLDTYSYEGDPTVLLTYNNIDGKIEK